MVEIIINSKDEQQDGFIPDFNSSGTGSIQQFFNQDNTIQAFIRTVIPNNDDSNFPWVEDYVAGDTLYFQIGYLDAKPTGGTYIMELDSYFTAAIDWNANLAQIQHQINTVSNSYGAGDVTVSQLSEGVYQIDWDNDGAVNNVFSCSTNKLQPACDVVVTQTVVGDSNAAAQQVIEIKQSAVASAVFNTAYSSLGNPDFYLETANSNESNAIYNFDLFENYRGEYSLSLTANGVTAVVVLAAEMSSDEIGQALAAHPEIRFQSAEYPDNILVSKNGNFGTIQFIGTLGGEASVKEITGNTVANPTIVTSVGHKLITGDVIGIYNSNSTPSLNGDKTVTVIDEDHFSVPENVTIAGTTGNFYNQSQPRMAFDNEINLHSPTGLTAEVNLNTIALAQAFWGTTDDSLDFPLQIKRTRASGEERTIYGATVNLKRNLVNFNALNPVIQRAVVRKGTQTCSTTDIVTVTFSSPMPTADYEIVECLVEFAISGTPLYKIAVATIDDRTVNGFVVYLSGNATTDYRIRYAVMSNL